MPGIARFQSSFHGARLPVLVLWLALLQGCQTRPPAKVSIDVPVPSAFQKMDLADDRAQASAVGGLNTAWWRDLGSRELDQLIDRGLAHNAELRISTLQIVQAKVRADQARAGGLPLITAPLRTAVQAPGGTVGTVPVSGSSNSRQTSFQTSLQGTWRLDVWGEQSAINESAELQLARAVFAREDIQRNLIAGLVSSYVGYRSLNDSIRLANENVDVARDILQSVERRLASQDATLSELEQQRAALHVQQVQIPVLEQQREDLKTSMAQMLGALPAQLVLSGSGLDELSVPIVEPGLPSSLLLRRPDIRMIEARMQAAHADIAVARARLLPPIDLSAQAGYSALTLGNLLQPQSLFWNTIASLAVTIFDGGRREGDKQFAQAYYEEMVETYAKTIFQAVREVESALSRMRNTRQKLVAQRAATRAALSVFKVANDAYGAGSLDLTALLDAQRAYQRQLEESQKVKAEWMQSYASLAHTLGAGTELGDGMPASARHEGLLPGPDDLILLGAPTEEAMHSGPWKAGLPGLFLRSSLGPMWRDLQTRFPEEIKGKQLEARQLGRVDADENGAAWFRLTVGGFQTERLAKDFCVELQQRQMACQVETPASY